MRKRRLHQLEEGYLVTLAGVTVAALARDIAVGLPEKRKTASARKSISRFN